MEALLILLASYGLCHSLMYGHLFDPLRNAVCGVPFLRDLLSCATCTGFWCGALLVWPRAPSLLSVLSPAQIFLPGALACAAVCTLLDAAYVRLAAVDPLEPFAPTNSFHHRLESGRVAVEEGNRLYVTVAAIDGPPALVGRRRTMTRRRFDLDYRPA